MDVFQSLQSPASEPILTVGMHTSGEPTRIVIRGVDPLLRGERLLDKRDDAKARHDHLRKRIMWEPRGHDNMYGAILVRETELTRTGTAHIGVLFCHNEGYSTMCGHATMALGRFLVDTLDKDTFAGRSSLKHDSTTSITQVNLHAPCGLVRISVPTTLDSASNRILYDQSRHVSFLSVPSFASAIDLTIKIPDEYRWPELAEREEITFDVSYGGAFYVFVTGPQLGFPTGLRGASLTALDHATLQLKKLVADKYKETHKHPTEPQLSLLYGVFVVDTEVHKDETGLCFYADQAIDRSPTGSGVGARIALAYAKGKIGLNQPKKYHSIVTLASAQPDEDAFVGEAVEEVEIEGTGGKKGVVVKTSGRAYYTDAAAYTAEKDDYLSSSGFRVQLPQ
ncbi:hypothetical protein JCM8097_001374 [Rhodosporidiobolus ruineniae]